MDKDSKNKHLKEPLVRWVLLVADEDDERSTLNNILIGQGCNVVAVSSLDEYKKADEDRDEPELIVLAIRNLDKVSFDAYLNMSIMQEGVASPFLIVCDKGENVEWIAGLVEDRDFVRRPYASEDVLARVKILLKLNELHYQLSQAREQLVEAQKMGCIGALAAGVVHEFNNLMFAVMGFAELARAKGGTDIEALRESAEISYETAKRATATATSLLAFSRQSKALKSMGNINDAIRSAVHLLKNSIEKSGVVINMNLADLPEIQFAFGPMQQVFLNLVINAWHALDDAQGDRSISITSRYIEDDKIGVVVKDTGMGIPADIQKQIFDPFVTTKDSNAEDGRGGTGLGLSIVKEVIRDHSGLVRVKSKVGEGAEFEVVLPVVNDDDLEDVVAVKPDDIVKDKYAILIVDDEESNRIVLTRLIRKRGHEAYSAANMAEAMTLLSSKKIDLITMDMIMPNEDGATNIARLREEGIELPILICTGHSGRSVLDKGLEAGANGIVMKPFSAAEFMLEMEKCIKNARKQSE